MKSTNYEEAVSPVIGVMLMIVVTIIIAAVVSGFAANLSGNTEQPPHASIKMAITSNGGPDHDQYIVTFKHLGGDSIPTKDVRIVSRYTSPGGKPYAKTLIAAQQSRGGCDIYGTGTMVRIPFISDVITGGGPGNPASDFGNFTFKPGDLLSTGASACTGNSLNTGLLSFDVTDPGIGFARGSEVEFTIVHIPSGVEIAHEKVIVE